MPKRKHTAYDDQIKLEIGLRIRDARKRGVPEMTQEQLGLACGLASSTVASWERGDSSPEGCVLARVCEALGESASWLIQEKAPRSESFSILSPDLGRAIGHHRLIVLAQIPPPHLRRLLDDLLRQYRGE